MPVAFEVFEIIESRFLLMRRPNILAKIGPGDMFVVPAGTEHDFTNTGNEALKLFTVYSPPEHPDGVVQVSKADARPHLSPSEGRNE